MQCQWLNNHPNKVSEGSISHLQDKQVTDPLEAKPVHFRTQFTGYMEMYSDVDTVADYLNAHQGWFCRCAAPMKTEPIGHNGYILTVGQFGSFGYEVEPKLAVVLEPSVNGVYHMHSIPIPDEPYLGYEVDYQASMTIKEIPSEIASVGLKKAFKKHNQVQLPEIITKVEWHLAMDVAVQFPKFIHKLPLSMIQKTGDRLLTQIVRQISPRLTYKVQEDFHSGHSLPIPSKTSRHLEKIEESSLEQAA
ncbi:conserved hypothetical protein [Crocosphaera subtropica ATCC 51142]|uniref:DUF1997 domain-containing protein n=1 Tax=Crocosphaera subtropica (strain ATCC 51142 / BH68) TaxID=43989 RepID=B1X1L2_CROS5|nr:DUF1997 domain-containing protein [Crocosphaera subtropica]ACB53042.1 conserved hypothetical protein [Crocosphaera subtropica ATCC 51142]